MASSFTFYTLIPVPTLEKIVESFQEQFDQLLEDCFSDEELKIYEKEIDAMGAIYVQPIFSELSFDDFYFAESEEQKQRFFFESAKSSILLDNLPYLESNPFQVSYLFELLKKFDEVLVDRGGVMELMFKESFLETLKPLKNMEQILPAVAQAKPAVKSSVPVDPIDFLILDVYKEIERTKAVVLPAEELSPKVQRILKVMDTEKLYGEDLLKATGLHAKDFDDGLERLKFWLRKF